MIAFHPAIEMPKNSNCTWSQRVSGAAMIESSRSAVVPPDAVLVHWVKPLNTFASTPA
jgi:hypothetical protein